MKNEPFKLLEIFAIITWVSNRHPKIVFNKNKRSSWKITLTQGQDKSVKRNQMWQKYWLSFQIEYFITWSWHTNIKNFPLLISLKQFCGSTFNQISSWTCFYPFVQVLCITNTVQFSVKDTRCGSLMGLDMLGGGWGGIPKRWHQN